MKSRHPFVADVKWPKSCRVCGRGRSAHLDYEREKARERAGEGVEKSHPWSPYDTGGAA